MLIGALPTLAQTHPPIPIQFKLTQPGFVTLVIDDAQGRRIRNLISETPYPAGENTAWWDGLDDLGRDADAASHAVYHIPGKIVAAATYQVHGLTRQKLDVRYQMTAYTNGDPPWHTKDQASEWLGNHQPPCSVMAIPAGAAPSRTTDKTSPAQVLVGSWVTEGGSGLAWLDENGRKLHGQSWLGGVWTGAQFLAYDAGPHPVSNVYAYAGSFLAGDKYNDNKSELRLHTLVSDISQVKAPKDKRFGTGEDPAILSPTYQLGPATQSGEARTLTGVNGLAVYNGILVASLPQTAELLFIDVAAHKTLGTAPLADPRGLAFDAHGRLIALSGTKLVRFALNAQDPTKLSKSEVLVTEGLVDPQQLAIDAQGAIYVSDNGNNNQVKVFGASGKLLRTIGHPGPSVAGPYDAEHMNEPAGLTIDSQGRLWVAEHDFQPKRVSVWNAQTGALLNAFYGPARYGGGGELDPTDKTLFYYDGMTFKLDWQARTSRPIDVFYREGPDTGVTPSLGVPQTPLYAPNGHQYLTSAFSTSPTSGSNLVGLWQMKNGVAQPVAVAGQSRNWPEVNFASRFSVRWSGQVQPQYSETYTFHVESDDRVRLMVNGQGIINNFKNHDRMTDTATIDLQAGKRYDISIEYSKPRSVA